MNKPSWLFAHPGLTALLLLALALGGCSEGTDTPSPAGTGMPPAGAPHGAAIYGVNVDVSYPDGQGLESSAMVYVFLRKPGTRMPLAVQHFAASELPKTVSFAGTGQDDAVELVVRLSPSGRVDHSPEDIEFVQVLPGLLHPPQTVAAVLGGAVPAAVAAGTPAPPPSAAVPVTLRAAVSIGEGSPFGPDSVVFVIAKRPGQAMPVAVKRLSVAELPAEIELSDADAMSFGNRLSDAASLELSARVSLSGTASRSEADWVSDTVRVEAADLPESIPLVIHAPGSA